MFKPEPMNLDVSEMDDFDMALHAAVMQGRVVKYIDDNGETLYKLAPQN